MFVARRKRSTNAEDNNMTSSDVSTRTTPEMPNAAAIASAKRTSGQRKPLVHRSTPNIAAAWQAEKKSRRPTGSDVDARAGARSASSGRQAAASATSESSGQRVVNSTCRSVTSRGVSKTTTTVRRPATPTPSGTATTSRHPPAAEAPPSLAASKKLFRSTGNLATTSVISSPPPRRRMSTNSVAAVSTSPMVVACHQPGSKPVVISGRGCRSQRAAAAPASTHDAGGKNASMRSRIGIAPNLLLPNCYQPGKTARSVSVDDSVTTPSTDVATGLVVTAATQPRFRRSVSEQEQRTSSSLELKTAFDSYPEPPPEDIELNSRMEMLFEEYRRVERGLIFTDEHSFCSDNTAADNNSSTSTIQPSTCAWSKSFVGGAAEKVTAASKRGGQTIGSTRTRSTGNLSLGSTTTEKKRASTSRMSNASSQQQRSDRTVRATSSSVAAEATTWMPRGRPSTTIHQRGQSSPGIGRRSAPAPSLATPPQSRKNEVPSQRVTTNSPRQSPQTGKVAAAPTATSTDVARPAPSRLHRTRSCGGAEMTRIRRDGLTSPQDVSRHGRDANAADVIVNNRSSRVDAATTQSNRRSSTPNRSVAASQRVVPRSAELARTNSCNGRNAVVERSRQSAAAVSDTRSRNSTQSASDEQLATVRRHSGHPTDQVVNRLRATERPSRPSTVGARSLIPRPVSCSGRRPASRRSDDRDAAPTRKPGSFEQVLRRFDSGVDVAAAELSPSDDGAGSLETAVQRLSDSLESCTLALLVDNNSRIKPTAGNAVGFNDDEYY